MPKIVEEWVKRHIQEEMAHYSDALNDRILKHLVKLDLLTQDQTKVIEKLHQKEGLNLVDAILHEKMLTEPQIGQAMAQFFKCTYRPLKETKIPLETLLLIPEDVAKSEGVILFKEDETAVYLAMLNPLDHHFLHLVEKKTGKKPVVFYTTPNQLKSAAKFYQQNLGEGIDHLIARATENIEHLESLDSISSIFDTLVLMAYNAGASDIHVEPFEDEIRIRFRVDGVLKTITSLPKHFLETMVNHIKVLSKIRVDEHNAAQDGRFSVKYDTTVINFRVSILPTYFGEKTVMRLLTSEAQAMSLEDLGYQEGDRAMIEKNIHKTSGIVLCTGPTGSGKTTTLYALLKLLNGDQVNISTIEDPIEYGLYGMNQIQVNPRTNLTYADGLKSLLRQDPDILMIGEIRDLDTAKISIHASLTGHLLLATLHTNSASLAPLRLIQMGVDPYLIVSTVNLIVAQRLVRRICQSCLTSFKLTKKQIKEFEEQFGLSAEDRVLFEKYFPAASEDDIRLFTGKGCKKCGNTGYRGRVVIAETLEMKDNVRDLILKDASQKDIEKAARKNGMISMMEDGFKKVRANLTTLDELFRVLNQ